MLTFLETERLLLRQFTPDDVELLVELDSDPRVMRYITGGIPTSRGEIEGDFLPAFLGYYQRYPGYGFWAALEKRSGLILRPVPLPARPRRSTRSAGTGLPVAPRGLGKGARDGGIAGADRQGVHRVRGATGCGLTMAVNTASRRVMEKSGTRLVRAFVADWPVSVPGEEYGDVEYAITRDEWETDDSRLRPQ